MCVCVQEFEKIECEWPLFFLYMIIEGMFKGSDEQVELYKNKLKPLVKRDKWGGEYWCLTMSYFLGVYCEYTYNIQRVTICILKIIKVISYEVLTIDGQPSNKGGALEL